MTPRRSTVPVQEARPAAAGTCQAALCPVLALLLLAACLAERKPVPAGEDAADDDTATGDDDTATGDDDTAIGDDDTATVPAGAGWGPVAGGGAVASTDHVALLVVGTPAAGQASGPDAWAGLGPASRSR